MRSAFIGLWIAVQVALPLRYYLGSDAFDERFAWRMFSAVRTVPCQTRFIDATGGTETIVRAGAELHEVWSSLLMRARRSVIEAYARRYCSERRIPGRPPPVLRVDVTCAAPDTLSLPICRGAKTEAESKALPEAYTRRTSCGSLSPADCFRRDCGDRTAAACRAERCQVRPIPDDLNLCEAL